MAVIPPPHTLSAQKVVEDVADNHQLSKPELEEIEERVQGTIRLYDRAGNVRKIPIPSSDPNDPLNWTWMKRFLILVTLIAYGTAGFGVVQSTPLFFGDLIQEYETLTRGKFNPSTIVNLASYPSLCMGLGNFLFVPLSLVLGRRPVFLFSNALMVAATIWAAKSVTFESHLAARCIQGLTCGLSECLLPLMVLDFTFLHKRGLWLSIYWASTATGSNMLLVIVPFVVESANNNWRFNYWLWTAFGGFSLILAIFFLPETLFARPPAMIDGVLALTDEYGNVTFVDGDEADIPQASSETPSGRSTIYEQFIRVHVRKDGIGHFLRAYIEMGRSLITPGIFWVLLVNTCLFAGLVALSLTYAQALSSPPWNFSEYTVGTAQLGSAIGALFALILIGTTVDPVSQFFTKRNGGIREPEHILPTFILPVIFAFLGQLVYGIVGANPDKYHWIGVHIAFGLFSCGFVSGSSVTGVWIGEVVPHCAGAALVLVCGGRNVLSFAISNEFTAWIATVGFQTAYITLGGIILGLSLFAIPLYFVNKSFRRFYTRHSGSSVAGL